MFRVAFTGPTFRVNGYDMLRNNAGGPPNLMGQTSSGGGEGYSGTKKSSPRLILQKTFGNIVVQAILSIICMLIVISQIICELFVYPGADLFGKIFPRAFIYPILLTLLIFYIIGIYASPTYHYLINFQMNNRVLEIVEETKKEKPEIVLTVECFHYETRTHTTRDANGHTRTHTTTVRVVTHTESRTLPFEFHRDFSPQFSFKNTNKIFIKLDMTQQVFVNDGESKKILDQERIAIYIANRGRDTHMDYFENWGTPNFQGQYLTCNPNLRTPRIATPFWYLTFCLFFVGWIYTIWFNKRCDAQDYTFIKQLSYQPFNDGQTDNNTDPTMYLNSGYGFSSSGSNAFRRTFNTTEQQLDMPANMFTQPVQPNIYGQQPMVQPGQVPPQYGQQPGQNQFVPIQQTQPYYQPNMYQQPQIGFVNQPGIAYNPNFVQQEQSRQPFQNDPEPVQYYQSSGYIPPKI